MQAPVPRSSRLGILALAVLVGCTLAACDKHSATEAPESYGHGSAHKKSYTDHQIDGAPSHYSDTQGTDNEKTPNAPNVKPSPAGTPGGHFF